METLLRGNLPDSVNCWGTALYAAGFKESAMPGFKSELMNFLGSKACRKLDSSEFVRPGDIGSIFTADDGIVHSYIVVDGHSIFEKEDPYKATQPRLISSDKKFWSGFALQTGCKSRSADGCAFGVVNYRCDSQIIESVRIELHERLQPARQKYSLIVENLKVALRTQSNAAVNDAMAHVLESIRESLRVRSVSHYDDSTQLSNEKMGALLVLLGAYPNVMGNLSALNIERLKNLSIEFEQVERQAPRSLEEFPQGQLDPKR